MMYKTSKTLILLLVTEIIFCNNPKVNGKSFINTSSLKHSDSYT